VRTLTSFRFAGRAVAVLAMAGALLTFAATDAGADTSTATAQAVNLTLGGGSLVTSGTNSASNPGGLPTVTVGNSPALGILGAQTTVTAGVLVQTAVATGTGTSAACAGLVGGGGSIQIGPTGACTVIGATPNGVTLNLPGLVTLSADAIIEECTASSTAPPTASAQLVNATVDVLGQPAISLPVNPTAGQTVSAFLLTLGLNVQTTPAAGEITGTALSLNVLNLVGLNIGNVTCGPNAATVATSAFPARSLPIVGGTILLMAAVAVPLYVRRRRSLVD
jgi:hypothetical protein